MKQGELHNLRVIEEEIGRLQREIRVLTSQARAQSVLAAREIREKYKTLFVVYFEQSKLDTIATCCITKEDAEMYVRLQQIADFEIVERETKDISDADLIKNFIQFL
jgi:hypothetical protein